MGLFDFFKGDKEQRARDQVALEIDIASGVLTRCPVCRAVTDRQRDDRLPAADVLAHEAFDRNDPQIAVFQGDRDDLLRRLRTVRNPLPYNCICQDAG